MSFLPSERKDIFERLFTKNAQMSSPKTNPHVLPSLPPHPFSTRYTLLTLKIVQPKNSIQPHFLKKQKRTYFFVV